MTNLFYVNSLVFALLNTTSSKPENIAKSSHGGSVFFFLIIVVLGIAAYFFFTKQNKQKDSTNEEKDKKINALINKLKELEREVYPQFLAYCIYDMAIKHELPIEERKKLAQKYGDVKAMPVIEFTEKFSIEEYTYLDNAIKKYLKEKNYIPQNSNNINLRHQFSNYIYEKAKSEAKKIIEDETTK